MNGVKTYILYLVASRLPTRAAPFQFSTQDTPLILSCLGAGPLFVDNVVARRERTGQRRNGGVGDRFGQPGIGGTREGRLLDVESFHGGGGVEHDVNKT
jgi:hypothetical protein